MTRCKNGTRKNKDGICVVKSPNKSKKTTRCKTGYRKDKDGNCVLQTPKTKKEKWSAETEKEFQEILNELRQGKLKKMDLLDKPEPTDCNSCLKQFSTAKLQYELDSRKETEKHINILIPRKKQTNA